MRILEAGYVNHDGYRVIELDGREHYAHDLAWLMQTGAWPQRRIEHINGNRNDNRWSNLRETEEPWSGLATSAAVKDRVKAIRAALDQLMKACGEAGESGTEWLYQTLSEITQNINWIRIALDIEKSHRDGLCLDVSLDMAGMLSRFASENINKRSVQ
jgi:HNH endonuclease